jgi:hypothetical protein
MCHLQGDKYKDQEPDAMDFLKECHYTVKKIQAYALAVQNAIVIDVKVEEDLFLSLPKFYGDQNMLC